MRAPGFWWTPRPGLAAHLLAPAGAVYGAATALRMHRRGAPAGVPVYCVGNLIAGGAGKTPTAIALAGLLAEAGRHPAILSRGYGGAGRATPTLVDPARHDAAEVGDEPLLLARHAPTVVCADRGAAARLAIAGGADCLVLDDGLQNPALVKDWSLVVADGASGIGNGLCLPAGPLRAPTGLQWPAVSMLCVIGEGTAGDRLIRRAVLAGVPVTHATLRPDAAVLARWRGRRLYAFAGLGRPQKFFATLGDAGLNVAGTQAFADHHRFTVDDLAALRQAAAGALLVTTTKDKVRLPQTFPAEALPVDLAFAEPDRIRAALGLRP